MANENNEPSSFEFIDNMRRKLYISAIRDRSCVGSPINSDSTPPSTPTGVEAVLNPANGTVALSWDTSYDCP